MKRSNLLVIALILTTYFVPRAQVGHSDISTLVNSFSENDSLVLVPAQYLAMLIRSHHDQEQLSHPTMLSEEDIRLQESMKLKQAGMKIYPKSTPDYLQVELPYEDDYEVTLYNTDNKQVLTIDKVYGTNQLDVRHLSQGKYRLEINGADNLVASHFFKE